MSEGDEDEPVEFPINGELDLHTFRPREVGELVPDYIGACLEKGISEIRIIHGKGMGTLRETVHALLRRDPRVRDFALAGRGQGGWGATLVRLVAPGEAGESGASAPEEGS